MHYLLDGVYESARFQTHQVTKDHPEDNKVSEENASLV